eukprot:jgi/Botrbrau1/9031/Bobra.0376s0008.1
MVTANGEALEFVASLWGTQGGFIATIIDTGNLMLNLALLIGGQECMCTCLICQTAVLTVLCCCSTFLCAAARLGRKTKKGGSCSWHGPKSDSSPSQGTWLFCIVVPEN